MWWWTDGCRGAQQIPAGSLSPYPRPTVSSSSFRLLALLTASGPPAAKARDVIEGSHPTWAPRSWGSWKLVSAASKTGKWDNSEASCLLCFLVPNTHWAKWLWWFAPGRRKKTGYPQIIQFELSEGEYINHFYWLFLICNFPRSLIGCFSLFRKVEKCSVERMQQKTKKKKNKQLLHETSKAGFLTCHIASVLLFLYSLFAVWSFSSCSVPGAVLGIKDTAGNKRTKSLYLGSLYSIQRDRQ